MAESDSDLLLARVIREYREANAVCVELETELALIGASLRVLAQNLEDVKHRAFVMTPITPLDEVAAKLGQLHALRFERTRLAKLRSSLDPGFPIPPL